jgi:hypothetical protein
MNRRSRGGRLGWRSARRAVRAFVVLTADLSDPRVMWIELIVCS